MAEATAVLDALDNVTALADFIIKLAQASPDVPGASPDVRTRYSTFFRVEAARLRGLWLRLRRWERKSREQKRIEKCDGDRPPPFSEKELGYLQSLQNDVFSIRSVFLQCNDLNSDGVQPWNLSGDDAKVWESFVLKDTLDRQHPGFALDSGVLRDIHKSGRLSACLGNISIIVDSPDNLRRKAEADTAVVLLPRSLVVKKRTFFNRLSKYRMHGRE